MGMSTAARRGYYPETFPTERMIPPWRAPYDAAPMHGQYPYPTFDSGIPYTTKYELKQSIDQRVESFRGRTRPWERTDCEARPSTLLRKKHKAQKFARKAPEWKRLLTKIESYVVRAGIRDLPSLEASPISEGSYGSSKAGEGSHVF